MNNPGMVNSPFKVNQVYSYRKNAPLSIGLWSNMYKIWIIHKNADVFLNDSRVEKGL